MRDKMIEAAAKDMLTVFIAPSDRRYEEILRAYKNRIRRVLDEQPRPGLSQSIEEALDILPKR